ncbi:MAG: DUF711 family protein [Nitrososphaerota archaeon]|nr:DUF711 family protein [Candidatus Bathyarchaeota archaeon]MDW8062018.1 DUF711 family protein [Nitrososphaerota archaeon]
MKIRAATLFLDLTGKDLEAIRRYLEDRVQSFLEALDEFRSRGVIWGRGVRVSVSHPYTDGEEVRIARIVREECEDIGVSMISGFVYDASTDDPRILEDLSSIGVYTSVKPGSPEYYGRVAEALSKISYRDPISLTRIGILLGGGGLLTPYFPLSMNVKRNEGVALALLYAKDLIDAYRSGGLIGMVESTCKILSEAEYIGRCIASRIGIDYYGLDYSLSPWMDDSVALLIEELAETTLPNPGSLHAISKINSFIREAAIRCKITSTGFCEIMLPVAEDNILKERVREGILRLRDLVALSCFCVAGVDMVVIPAEALKKILAGMMLDLSEVSRLKGKPIGLRIIPYPKVKPGDQVDLGVFGRTPVISI